ANGGYLVVQVNELSKNPASYEGLKRALQSERIAIEEAGEKLMTNTKSLTPEAIPLAVKVVLIGDPASYQELYTRDPEFGPLFKVKAQFDETVGRNPSNAMMYARFVHTLCEAEGLRHLESAAIAKVVEHGSRLAGDQAKLSTRFSELADVVRRPGARGDHRHRAGGEARGPDPHEGGPHHLGVPRGEVRARQAPEPVLPARVRAELRGGRGGQRLERGAVRDSLRALWPAD